MQNRMLIFFLFTALSTSQLMFTMEEQNSAPSNITENNDYLDLENIEQVYLEPSILDQANDIHEAIKIIAQHISKCHAIIFNNCENFKDLKALNISHEQWFELNQTIRKLYIPYLNDRFLEKRNEQGWLFPKNGEWFVSEEQPINDHIAYFISTQLTPDNNLLTHLVQSFCIRSNLFIESNEITSKSIIKLITLLLFYGVDPNTKDSQMSTPLNRAIRDHHSTDSNNLELISLLLQYGANPDLRDLDGSIALYMLAVNHNPIDSNNTEPISLLLKHGANPNLQDSDGLTPLFILARSYHPVNRNNIELITLLLQYEANPNLEDSDGLTILCMLVRKYSRINQQHTVYCNNIELISLLLQFCANPYLKCNDGKTAFDLAEEKNFTQFKELIFVHAKDTLKKICLLSILNNLSLLEDGLHTLPIDLQNEINNLKN